MLIKLSNYKYIHILSSIAIQFVGVLSSFIIILLIARLQGVENQGEFIKIKSYFDIFLVLGLAGLPQSFIYFINKFMATRTNFFRFSLKYIVAFVVCLFFGLIILNSFSLLNNALNIDILLVLALASIGYISHGLWRGLYLTYNSKNHFALLTILPSLYLMLIVIVFIFFDNTNYQFIFLFSSVLLLITSYRFIRSSLNDAKVAIYNKVSTKELMQNGLYVFIHSVMLSLQVLTIYYLIEYFGGNSKDIGLFSSSYYVYQIPAVLLAMVSPLLFNFIVKNSHQKRNVIRTSLLFTGIISIFVSFGIYIFASSIVMTLFGREYSDAVGIMEILSFGIVPFVLQRIIMVYIDSNGKQKQNAIISIVKFILFVALSFLLFYSYNFSNILSVLYAYVAIEYAILTIYFIKSDLLSKSLK